MKKRNFQQIKEELPGIKRNVSLKNYTTFKIGGPAKYFFEAKNKKDLIKAILVAKKFKLPFFVLGGGSNLLVSDEGFKGLVIKILFSKFYFLNSQISAEAGTILGQLVSATSNTGLTGLEWAAGIPGTVGGAVFGNAGAFQKSMKDIVKEVEVLDAKDLRFKIYDFKKCQFGYRDSIFKHKKNLIILSIALNLKKGKKSEIKKKIKEYLNYKKQRQPLNYPSAGSIFKNPSGFSAGELIEKCGLKGKRIGQAKISEKHANFIVNLGNARAKDVKKLINLIKKEVKKKFKINLEEEIRFL
ncbi:MAG: UDP-N-acetylmuramate dehydrogenase [bacterium]|nr:UDP-N-acetylmuramate dehydrogenase [bacterium]